MSETKFENHQLLYNMIDDYNKTIETSPKFEGKELSLKIFNSKIGELLIMANEEGICFLQFSNETVGPIPVVEIAKKLNSKINIQDNTIIFSLIKELDLYLEGKLLKFSVPLQMIGTEFQKSVWQALLQIPPGETWSYKKQAECIGDAKKARAVALANSKNPICILIPCHRVIKNDGNISGYSGGVGNKKKLLELEKAILL